MCAIKYEFAYHRGTHHIEGLDIEQSVLGSDQIWPFLASKGKADGWPTHEGQETPSQRGNAIRLEGLVADQAGEGRSD